MSQIHPKPDDHFKCVTIHHPSTPSPMEAWQDPRSAATAVPRSDLPATLNGVRFEAWQPPFQAAQWEELAKRTDFPEPYFSEAAGKATAAGAVILEPDGRVWIVSPTNRHGGYNHTFPKGSLTTPGPQPLRAGALKNAYEKTGLHIELTAFLCDCERGTSITRYFLARRVGGTPSEMRWKSQAVHLVPAESLSQFLTHENDQPVLNALQREAFKALSHRPTKKDLQRTPWLTSEKRILRAVEQYRNQFGEWPTRIRMDPGMFEAIPMHSLTPLGWAMLTNRMAVVAETGVGVVAEGAGRVEYGEEVEAAQDCSQGSIMADEWIWGLPLRGM